MKEATAKQIDNPPTFEEAVEPIVLFYTNMLLGMDKDGTLGQKVDELHSRDGE